MRVLVVDADPDRRDLVILCVGVLGHTATAAATVQDALDALSRRPYDLVVVDSTTPGLAALEATRAIRTRWADPQHPVVVIISADLGEASRVALTAAGATEAIAGPPTVGLLRQVLARSTPRGGTI